jgi:hypothetical protein
MTNVSQHTFNKGLDKDSALEFISNQAYIDAENIRLVSERGNTTGVVENIQGNLEIVNSSSTSLSAQISTTTGSTTWQYLGHQYIREDLYLFVTRNATLVGNLPNYIFKVTFDGEEWDTITSIYSTADNSELQWARVNPIKSVGRYESEEVQKIYLVDGVNPTRVINVADPDVATYPVSRFDLVGDVDFGEVSFDSVISGNLPVGKVQYTYQYYNNYGAETFFSPFTNLYHITNSSITGNDLDYIGAEKDAETNRGYKFSISDVDTDYDNIRIIAITYTDINSIPTVRVIDEKPTASTIYFNDVGQTLAELTLEEVTIASSLVLTPREIATKSNRLFVANATEDYFDFVYDTRAYRFEVTGTTARVYEEGGSHTDITAANWGTWDPITVDNLNGTKDAINYYNDPDEESTNQYKYNTDGELGGEGPNVKYMFESGGSALVSLKNIDDIGSSAMTFSANLSGGRYPNYSDIQNSAETVGYQRDEVYRFAAVGINAKGQESPAKWIGDIRMPDPQDDSDFTIASYVAGTDTVQAKFLGISFTFKNVPSEVKAIKIVRAKRTLDDRRIVAQGLASHSIVVTNALKSNTVATPITPTMLNYDPVDDRDLDVTIASNKVTILATPESSFGNTIQFKAGDYLEVAGVLGEVDEYTSTNFTYSSQLNNGYVIKYKDVAVNSVPQDTVDLAEIYRFETTADDTYNNEDNRYTDYFAVDADGVDYYMRGASVVNSIGAILPAPTLQTGIPSSKNIVCIDSKVGAFGFAGTVADITAPETYLVNYKRKIFDSQYGGPTLRARATTEYISTGFILSAAGDGFTTGSTYTTPEVVYGGDTYIAMYDHLFAIYPQNIDSGDGEDNRAAMSVIYFPVETSINLDLRHDNSFHRIYSDNGAYIIGESAGTRELDNGTEFTFDTDYYLYNTVYSQENTTKKYYTRDDAFVDQSVQETRVYVSDEKFNNELSDSWTKFRTNENKDVEAEYGPITDLVNYKDRLLFFQDRAFGVLSVNPRSVISDNNPGALVLGTGGVLDRYDYVTTDSGKQCRKGIVISEHALYFYDNYNSTIYKYSNQLEPVNKLNGLDTYFDIEFNSNTSMVGVHDHKYNDVLFSFRDNEYQASYPTHKVTLLYNENFDVFVSKLDTKPFEFIQLYNNDYIGYSDVNTVGSRFVLYMYNKGEYGNFDGVVNASEITLVDNDKYPLTKVYDEIVYTSKSINYSGANPVDNPQDTFDLFQVYTDYQNTDTWNLVYKGTKNNASKVLPVDRKERNWSIQIPRDATTGSNIFVSLDTTQLFADRIRNNYALIRLVYNNTNNYKITLPTLLVGYRISKR